MHETPVSPGATVPVNPHVRFERRDANVRAIAIAGGVIVVVSVAVHLLVSGVFTHLTDRPPTAGSMQAVSGGNRLVFPQDFSKVPAPRLQVNETRDLERLREQEAAFLENSGRSTAWVEKGKVVSVPITEAMRLLSDPQTAQALGIQMRPAAKPVEPKK